MLGEKRTSREGYQREWRTKVRKDIKGITNAFENGSLFRRGIDWQPLRKTRTEKL